MICWSCSLCSWMTQDFKCFVDLSLALQNKKEAAAVNYFFRILDVNRTGFLEPFTLYYFFKDIMRMLEQNGQEVLQFNDICTEIFDIVKPADPNHITCQDLIDCSQADVVVTLLTDFSGFNEYETRDLPPAAPDVLLDESDPIVVWNSYFIINIKIPQKFSFHVSRILLHRYVVRIRRSSQEKYRHVIIVFLGQLMASQSLIWYSIEQGQWCILQRGSPYQWQLISILSDGNTGITSAVSLTHQT